VNIAVIKYWGKRDEKLILPLNSSVSGTLHQESLRTQTTVCASEALKEDEIILNGKYETEKRKRGGKGRRILLIFFFFGCKIEKRISKIPAFRPCCARYAGGPLRT
jgi:hypothetical protein